MAIKVGEFDFHGPFKHLKMIDDKPGVFAVHYYYTGHYYLLDVDHADHVHSALQEHPRQPDWERFRRGMLTFSVMYTEKESPADREACVRQLRREYEPACGRVI